MKGLTDRMMRLGVWFGPVLAVALGAVLYVALRPYAPGSGSADPVGDLARKVRLVEDMRVLLVKSSETEKNAIMSDIDEEAAIFAREAAQAARDLEEDRKALEALAASGGDAREIQLCAEFTAYWREFQAAQDKLLELAVANSNPKAFVILSRRAEPALAAFLSAVDAAVRPALSGPNALEALASAGKAKTAALQFMVKLSPHIIEESDAAMDAMEAAMAVQEAAVRDGLDRLGALCGEAGAAKLTEAARAFASFRASAGEILALSRHNSKIKAIALSLGAKRKVEGLCQESLTALRDLILGRGYKSTR